MKSKVVAVAAAFVLVSGASIAFGASDAGSKLKEWYDAQFGQASANIETTTDEYFDNHKAAWDIEFNGMKEVATTKINNSRDTQTSKASTNIGKKLGEHRDAIDNKRAEIERNMNRQFSIIKDEAVEMIRITGNEMSAIAETEMYRHAGVEGGAALESVNTELTATTNQAISDLEEAIENAKATLQEQLNNNQTKSIEEINGLIDKKVDDVRIWATFMTNFAVQQQTDLIEAKAKELEEAAKKAMQDLVDGI